MARPKSNTVDYFPHYISDGKKMFIIESKYGNDGYAVWFKLLEILAKTEDHFLNLGEDTQLMYVASKCRVSNELLQDIISDMVALGVFNKTLWKYKVVWSQDFVDSVQAVYRKRGTETPTYEGLWYQLSRTGVVPVTETPILVTETPQSKVKYSIVEETTLIGGENSIDPLTDVQKKLRADILELFEVPENNEKIFRLATSFSNCEGEVLKWRRQQFNGYRQHCRDNPDTFKYDIERYLGEPPDFEGKWNSKKWGTGGSDTPKLKSIIPAGYTRRTWEEKLARDTENERLKNK